jgi:hypothetical protein
MYDDIEYTFDITVKVTARTDVDAFRMLAPALDQLRLLDSERRFAEVELVSERKQFDSPATLQSEG